METVSICLGTTISGGLGIARSNGSLEVRVTDMLATVWCTQPVAQKRRKNDCCTNPDTWTCRMVFRFFGLSPLPYLHQPSTQNVYLFIHQTSQVRQKCNRSLGDVTSAPGPLQVCAQTSRGLGPQPGDRFRCLFGAEEHRTRSWSTTPGAAQGRHRWGRTSCCGKRKVHGAIQEVF